MRTTTAIGVIVASAVNSILAIPCARNDVGIIMPQAVKTLERKYQQSIREAVKRRDSCTEENILVRRSWDDLTDPQRHDYIRAVKCLAASPATVDKALAPGVVNRLDDFTYIHINQTNTVHNSGSFLPWHRLFIWRMEQALRDECGYEGALPYWDSPRFSPDQTASKVWDGSMTSFGGDGEYLADGHGPFAVIIPGLAINLTTQFPAGTGGGCVRDGPFANFSVSLGPVDKPYVDPTNKYGYGANPRCLRRNFDPASSAALSWDAMAEVLNSPDIATFRRTMDNIWHRPSHAFIGRDGVDLFTSPNDPAFYLLHAQVDRLWAIWQGQDMETREYTAYGNRTFEGIPLDTAPMAPPSNVTFDDVMDLGGGYKPLLKEGLSMTEGGRCYVYV